MPTTTQSEQPVGATTTFDKDRVKELLKALEEHLAPFAKAHGVSVKLGRCGYDARLASLKLEFGADAGVAYPVERAIWQASGPSLEHLYKIRPEALDAQFRFNGRDYTLVGLSAARRKSPFAVVRDDNKLFFVSADLLRRALPSTLVFA